MGGDGPYLSFPAFLGLYLGSSELGERPSEPAHPFQRDAYKKGGRGHILAPIVPKQLVGTVLAAPGAAWLGANPERAVLNEDGVRSLGRERGFGASARWVRGAPGSRLPAGAGQLRVPPAAALAAFRAGGRSADSTT